MASTQTNGPSLSGGGAGAGNTPVPSGTALYSALAKIMVRPETLIEMADATLERERVRAGKSELDGEIRELASKKTIEHYAKLAGISGGTTALAGIIPGIGTATAILGGGAVDLVVTMKLQAEMALQIAYINGTDIVDEEKKHFAFLIVSLGLTANAGQEAAANIASKALKKLTERHLRNASLAAVKKAFQVVGVTFARKAFVKAIPFGVGATIGLVSGNLLTKKVGKDVQKYYQGVAQAPTSESVIDVDDVALRDLDTEE